jgi:hypothetical protein
MPGAGRNRPSCEVTEHRCHTLSGTEFGVVGGPEGPARPLGSCAAGAAARWTWGIAVPWSGTRRGRLVAQPAWATRRSRQLSVPDPLGSVTPLPSAFSLDEPASTDDERCRMVAARRWRDLLQGAESVLGTPAAGVGSVHGHHRQPLVVRHLRQAATVVLGPSSTCLPTVAAATACLGAPPTSGRSGGVRPWSWGDASSYADLGDRGEREPPGEIAHADADIVVR